MPAGVLALAVAHMHGRPDWGRAMQAELGHVLGVRQRWRFSLGCARAMVAIHVRGALRSREGGGSTLRAVVFGAVVTAAGLVAYGFARYPGLRSGSDWWAALAGFVCVLAVYAAVALTLSRGMSPDAAFGRRYGLVGGILVGGAWSAVLSPGSAFKAWVAFPLLAALLGPAILAAVAARHCDDAGTGTLAALWSGIVGGLGLFIFWVAVTYAGEGRPYDVVMLRDFRHSHAPDIATYAVGDNLGTAFVLLLLIPTVALAVGSLSARAAVSPRRSRRSRSRS
jgi:hypothetical protein